MGNYFADRLESRIVQAINTLIVNGEIKNPKLNRFASVSDISLSKDNAYAKVYITCLDDKALDNSVKALQSAAGFIQARLASALKTKNTPKLTFLSDDVERTASRIESILESVKVEQ